MLLQVVMITTVSIIQAYCCGNTAVYLLCFADCSRILNIVTRLVKVSVAAVKAEARD